MRVLAFDPFNGSSQTAKVARHLDRHYVGFDIEPKYVEYARRRLPEAPAFRSEQPLAVLEKTGLSIRSLAHAKELPLLGRA